jgi:hypothetical protein
MFSLAALVSMLLINGCSKKDDNPVNPVNPDNNTNNSSSNSVTVNGDGYNNQTFEGVSIASTATYIPNDNVTGCQFVVNAIDGTQIIFYFKGKTTGTYQWDLGSIESTSKSGFVFRTGTSATNMKFYFSKANSGSVKITSYGNIGQTVSGTFSGTLYNMADDTKTITVSGKFSSTRTIDGE